MNSHKAINFDTATIDAAWVSSLGTNPAGNLMLSRITLSDFEMGDANNDQAVDVSDLGILARHYGEGSAVAAGALPEPSTTGLLWLLGMRATEGRG